MKKVATITFHSSYNLGSSLQAYALQEFVRKLDSKITYEIINLRTDRQKDMYVYKRKTKNIKIEIKKLFYKKHKNEILKREEKYENFINEYLKITKEYNNISEIEKDNLNYDFYISGSDQIWNMSAKDFEWANFLEFVEKGKKISYAASFGPKLSEISKNEEQRIIRNLKQYNYISVREEKSAKYVYDLIDMMPSINSDPTLLINAEDWEKIICPKRIIKEKYILLYDIYGDKNSFKLAQRISSELKLPVYIIKENKQVIFFNKFKHIFNCGPLDFLNIIKNASLVLSSSFHGTVFSIIFNKPFYAINGVSDNRISTLLKKCNLLDRSVTLYDYKNKMIDAYNLDFTFSNNNLIEEQKKSEKYLRKALNIK